MVKIHSIKDAAAETFEYRYRHFTSIRLRIWRRIQISNKKLVNVFKKNIFGLLLKFGTPCI